MPSVDKRSVLTGISTRSTAAKAKSTISELLSLTSLPEKLKSEIRQRQQPISKSLLIEIARLEDETAQLQLWGRLGGLDHITVRAVRAAKRPTAKPKSADEGRGAVTAGRQFMRRLDSLEQQHLPIEPELQQVLEALQSRIDNLLTHKSERKRQIA